MQLSPSVALGFFTLALLLIYIELNRPGRVVPGALGLLLALLACARIGAAHPRPVALVLMVTAAILLVLDLVRATHWMLAAAATGAMLLGFRDLVRPPVSWIVCVLCAVGLGVTTTALTRVARLARASKASQKNI